MTPLLKIKDEEGVVKFPASWNEVERVTQLDFLQDWISELQKAYNAILTSENNINVAA